MMPGYYGTLSGPNRFTTDTNPLLNITSIPTGNTFGRANVTQHLGRMAQETPSNQARVISGLPTMTGPRNPHLDAISRLTAQIGQGQYGQNRLSLLRNPITTGGPQLQLSAHQAAAEQLRDQEQLSNIYMQNAFAQAGQNTQNVSAILRMLGM